MAITSVLYDECRRRRCVTKRCNAAQAKFYNNRYLYNLRLGPDEPPFFSISEKISIFQHLCSVILRYYFVHFVKYFPNVLSIFNNLFFSMCFWIASERWAIVCKTFLFHINKLLVFCILFLDGRLNTDIKFASPENQIMSDNEVDMIPPDAMPLPEPPAR